MDWVANLDSFTHPSFVMDWTFPFAACWLYQGSPSHWVHFHWVYVAGRLLVSVLFIGLLLGFCWALLQASSICRGFSMVKMDGCDGCEKDLRSRTRHAPLVVYVYVTFQRSVRRWKGWRRAAAARILSRLSSINIRRLMNEERRHLFNPSLPPRITSWLRS